jgi:hypothetical protein
MSEISDIKKRLSSIENRNRKVELDKAWETCWLRRFYILVLTYILIALYMNIIGVDKAWLNAVVPSLGFLVSTLTIGYLKLLWIKRQK